MAKWPWLWMPKVLQDCSGINPDKGISYHHRGVKELLPLSCFLEFPTEMSWTLLYVHFTDPQWIQWSMNPYLRLPGPDALCPASCKTQTTQQITLLAIPKFSADQKNFRCPSKNQNWQLYNKWSHPPRQILSPFVINKITLNDNKNHWAKSGTWLNKILWPENEDDF